MPGANCTSGRLGKRLPQLPDKLLARTGLLHDGRSQPALTPTPSPTRGANGARRRLARARGFSKSEHWGQLRRPQCSLLAGISTTEVGRHKTYACEHPPPLAVRGRLIEFLLF